MEKVKKIIVKSIIILICICLMDICIPLICVKAETPIGEAEKMKADLSEPIDTSQFQTIVGRVLGVIQVVAALVAVLTIAYTGFEYIMVGTPDMKREIKNKMLPIIVSLILIFGAVSIAKFIMAAFE